MEAVYLLAIAKSPRAASDRELVHWDVARDGGHAQVAGVAREEELTIRAQADFQVEPAADHTQGGSVQKTLRVNGIQRSAADFVGAFNAVAFSADDIDLVSGPPAVRRRYLDILISQSDPSYLKTLQRYSRVVTQRNHLLRQIRERRADAAEMDFWNERLVSEAVAVIERRAHAVRKLMEETEPRHASLSGSGERLEIAYRPRLRPSNAPQGIPADTGQADSFGEGEDLRRILHQSLDAVRTREVAQGVTVVGPHRDEVELKLDGELAGSFSSRGQARSIALALRLAEAAFVKEATGRTPVLALDDVLSELDWKRRRLVLEAVAEYEQTLITITDFDRVGTPFLEEADRYVVTGGEVKRAES